MKIYVTKYLFTAGIQEKEAELCSVGNGQMVKVGYDYFHGDGRDWHRTRKAAIAHAQVMRAKKLAALDKQRRKIEAMEF